MMKKNLPIPIVGGNKVDTKILKKIVSLYKKSH